MSGQSQTVRQMFIHAGPGTAQMSNLRSNQSSAAYVDDHVAMLVRDGQSWDTYYYHADALFNVLALTDANAALAERAMLDPYGTAYLSDGAGDPLAVSAVGNPFLRQGQVINCEVMHYQSRAREYVPTLGRFAQRASAKYHDEQNMYQYSQSGDSTATAAPGLMAISYGEACVGGNTVRGGTQGRCGTAVPGVDPGEDCPDGPPDRLACYSKCNELDEQCGRVVAQGAAGSILNCDRCGPCEASCYDYCDRIASYPECRAPTADNAIFSYQRSTCGQEITPLGGAHPLCERPWDFSCDLAGLMQCVGLIVYVDNPAEVNFCLAMCVYGNTPACAACLIAAGVVTAGCVYENCEYIPSEIFRVRTHVRNRSDP
ncbi:MAG: hypothetical protein L6Q92_13210 [Phycisphaerae bacterium]|nr:hypothetical protein [Phycisphaerae bacterium]